MIIKNEGIFLNLALENSESYCRLKKLKIRCSQNRAKK